MRNLKRALSLALASVMLLGMMVVGAGAASYPDVDENDNVEAIEVLNAVNVMIGRQGNFEPDEAVNRHEMAVIMAKLVLGNEAADNYVGSHPFTDVVPWADKYVAACYENGLVAGTSATTFSGSKSLTAVEAAAMMLRALGYKDLNKGYQGDWRAPITAKANQIRLFDGVAANPNEKLNRNQVAQLALNTLKSPMVTLIDGTFTATDGNGQITLSGGSRKYEVIGRKAAYATAISDVETEGTGAEGIKGYTVELGEHLYNGKLKLSSITDDFGRPARQWEYDGKKIGTYVKDELLRQVWTQKVTGKMIYDVLTKSVIEGSNKYDFTIAVDGVLNTNRTALGTAYFDEGYLNSNHKEAVGKTGNGVTTEVYVDSGEKQVYISVINTYLAKATGDYNAARETATYNVYGLSNKGTTSNPVFVKTLTANVEDKVTVTVSADDFNIAGVKKDDIVLVNVADGTIQKMEAPEVMSGVSLSAFAKNDYVVSEGSTIKYNNAAEYDFETLDKFTGVSGATNLRDKHYNLYLDKNGYLAGIEAVEEDANYIFLTGIDAGTSDLTNKTADAAGILMDGTFINMKVNMDKSKTAAGGSFSGGSMWNTWCTYSVDNSGVYTLKQVGADPTATGSGKVAQAHSPAYVASSTAGKDINIKNYSLPGAGTYTYVYGNENSVYMTAKMKVIKAKEAMSNIYSVDTATGALSSAMSIAGNDNVAIISGVDTRTVGIANTDMTTWTGTQIYGKFTGTTPTSKAANEYLMPSGVYTLFNNKGYVVASIVIGEDNGIATNLVLVNSSDIKEESFKANAAKATAGEWVWSREVIDLNNGEVTKIYEKGDTPSVIDAVSMPQWTVAQIKLNGDDYVTGANKGAAITGAKYVDDITDLENQIATSGKDLVAFKSTAIGVEPTFKGNTLHVNNSGSEGVPVNPDVKTVLIKKTDGASETTEYSGSNELDTVLATLNKDKNGKVSFEITALIKGGRAITIVVRDRNETQGQVNEKPDEDKSTVSAGVYVDLSAPGAVAVYQEGATKMSKETAVEEITAALKDAGYTIKDGYPKYDGTNYTWEAKKGNGAMTTFTFAGTSAITAGQIVFTVNGETAKAASGAKLNSVGVADTYIKYKAKDATNYAYVLTASATGINITSGMEVITKYYKVAGVTANVVQGLEAFEGSLYAAGDAKVVPIGKKGTGFKASTKYLPYGCTFAEIDVAATGDGTKDGTATFGDMEQVCITVDGTKAPVAYNGTGSISGATGAGTFMKVNGEIVTAASSLANMKADAVVETGYVKIAGLSVDTTAADAGIKVEWKVNNETAKAGDYVKATVDKVHVVITLPTAGITGKTGTSVDVKDAGSSTIGAFADGGTSVRKAADGTAPTNTGTAATGKLVIKSGETVTGTVIVDVATAAAKNPDIKVDFTVGTD